MRRIRVYKIALLTFSVLFFTIFNLVGQTVKVDAKLDTNQILIGDQIKMHLQVLQPENARVFYPNMEDQLPEGVDVIREETPDTLKLDEENMFRINQSYTITSFDTGAVNIPSLNFLYEINGETDSISTYPMNLMVQTVKVDTTKTIFDIKMPYGAPISFAEILPYLGGLVALALIVFLVIYFLRKRKRKEPEEVVQKPSEPAHIIALRGLDELKEQKIWQQGKVKEYYTRLTEILRNYLWLRYDIKTLERTTEEILQSLKNTGFEQDELFEKLKDTLKTADLVKFAKWQPTERENEKSLEQAYDFVNRTKQEKKPVDEKSDAEEAEEQVQYENQKTKEE